MTSRHRPAAPAALLVALAALALAPPARAQYYGPAYAAPLYVVTPDRSLLSVDGQYFTPSPNGLRELCLAKPDLCQAPEVQAQMARIRRRQVAFWSLTAGGGAAILTGGGLMIAGVTTSGRNVDSALLTGGLIVLGVGTLAELASLFVAPTQDDLRHVVNTINAPSTEPRIKWNLGLGPGGLPHLAARVRL